MNRDEYLGSIAKYIGRLSHEIRALNAIGRFDINSTTEDFLVPILKVLFFCPELRNQNQIQHNFPAVDLGCRLARISFQVTSDASSSKIAKTLEKFRIHGLNKHFDSVYIIIITEKQFSYNAKTLDNAIAALPISFSKTDNILDLSSILSKINLLDTDKLGSINSYLKNEFERHDAHSHFRSNLNQFLEFSASKIDIEKSSRKYIPEIFIETHSTKEEMRAFIYPMFFYRKVQDVLANIDYRRLNDLFTIAREPTLAFEIKDTALRKRPAAYEQLKAWSNPIGDMIDKELAKVRPLSWRREEWEIKYSPRNENRAIWSLVRVKVESVATGITQRLGDARTLLQLMHKKIFLITGMAGQGKTNFVCDLIENQFAKFEVPCVFIPARELNRYQSHGRIFGFIANNRYSPNFVRLHEYLDLLNKIGGEIGKPFIICIDGINEVKALEEFSDELKEFCGAVCQYDFIKIIITCRSEFFDEKYASILNEPYMDQIHRVTDLRANMSSASKNRLLTAYLRHFEVKGTLAGAAEDFLKNDLLLLRIFCERHEGQNVGYTEEIYKGDLFEDFLLRKLQSIPQHLKAKAFPTLMKIAGFMLAADDYARLVLRDFDADEQQIVQHLVADDVILRRELEDRSLSSYGDAVVSFTYDELRDFVIAYKLTIEVTESSADGLEDVLSRLPGRPIYEGVYKYVYLLARKTDKALAIAACERATDFIEHYSLNIELLPPAYQTSKDVERVKEILADMSAPQRVISVAAFLHRRRNTTELLNIALLIDHMNRLNTKEHLTFIGTLFSNSNDFGSRDWRQRIGEFIERVWEVNSETGLSKHAPEWIAFFLHVSSHAGWVERERAATLLRTSLSHERFQKGLDLVRTAEADAVCLLISEIDTAPKDAGQ